MPMKGKMAGRDAQRESLGEIFTRDFLMISTVNLCMFFGFQMLNVGLPVYIAQLGATSQMVGLATTLITVTATFVRVFTGALLDRFGRMGMLIGGGVIMVCSIVSYAIFPVVGIIMGLRLLHGIGWGFGSTASSTIAADIIPKRRFAEGMGYFALTNALSSAIAPAVSIELVQGVGSVHMIIVAAGITVLSLVLSVIEAFIGRRNSKAKGTFNAPEKPPAQTQVGDLQAVQQQPDSVQAAHLQHKPGQAQAAHPQPASAPSKLETLFERRAVVPGILMLLVNVGFGCITTFIALHADNQGVGGVSLYFIVYAVVSLLTRPYIGRLIDRYGYRVPAILSSACTAGTLVFIGFSSNIWMFAGAGVLGGLGIGTSMGTFQAMAVASVEPWRRGVATSTYMTAFDTGIAVGSLLGGFLVDAFGYTVMYVAIALFPLAAGVVSAAVVKDTTPSIDEKPEKG